MSYDICCSLVIPLDRLKLAPLKSKYRLFKAANGQGVWAGHFGRDHFQLHKEVAELFLFSNSDYYLPQKYLESEVLEKRRREGARFSATRW